MVQFSRMITFIFFIHLQRAGVVFPQRPPPTTVSSGQTGPSSTYNQNARNARQEANDTSTESEFPTLRCLSLIIVQCFIRILKINLEIIYKIAPFFSSLTEIQNAKGIMDVLAEMLNAIDGNNKEVYNIFGNIGSINHLNNFLFLFLPICRDLNKRLL